MLYPLEHSVSPEVLAPFERLKDLELPTLVKSMDPEVRVDGKIETPYWLAFADISEGSFRVLVKSHLLLDFTEIDAIFSKSIENYDNSNWLLQHIRGNVIPHIDRDSGGNSILLPVQIPPQCTVFAESTEHNPTVGRPFVLNTTVKHGAYCPIETDTMFLAYVAPQAKA